MFVRRAGCLPAVALSIGGTYKGSGQYKYDLVSEAHHITPCMGPPYLYRTIRYVWDHRISTVPSGVYRTNVSLPYHQVCMETTVSLPYHQVCMGPPYLYRTTRYVWDHRISTVPSGMYGTTVSLRDHQVCMYVWDHRISTVPSGMYGDHRISTVPSGMYGTTVSLPYHQVCMGTNRISTVPPGMYGIIVLNAKR